MIRSTVNNIVCSSSNWSRNKWLQIIGRGWTRPPYPPLNPPLKISIWKWVIKAIFFSQSFSTGNTVSPRQISVEGTLYVTLGAHFLFDPPSPPSPSPCLSFFSKLGTEHCSPQKVKGRAEGLKFAVSQYISHIISCLF